MAEPVQQIEAGFDENQGVSAWMLQVAAGIQVAVGQYEVIHIVDRPDYISVPQAPAHCHHVILWNNHIVPVMELSVWLTGHMQPGGANIVGIVAYERPEGGYAYGGLGLSSIPTLHQVNNQQFCELPSANSDKWQRISLSCFTSETGQAVPVLDLPLLFSDALSAD